MKDPRKMAMAGRVNPDPLLEAMMGAPPVEQDGLPLYPSISDAYPPDRLAAERTLPDDDLNDYMSDVDPMRKMKRAIR